MRHKRRWRCPSPGCEAGVLTEQDPSIAPARAALTARAARRAGRGDSLKDTAGVPGCDWGSVNRAVLRRGALR